MSSGGKTRNTKNSKGGANRNIGGATDSSTLIKQNKSDHNHNDKSKENLSHKIAPTAEQLRIAQMIDNTHPEKVLQEKINQVVLVTGVSTDDAIVALHDCNNDVNAAIDSLLEGEDQGEWQESTKRRKKPPISKSKEEVESNKENRKVDNRDKSASKSRSGGPGVSGGKFRGRGGGSGGRGNRDSEVGEWGGSRGGSFNRRGRMTNGSGPPSRGRGMRGRGSATSHSRTFQREKRQPDPPVFTETIDTWGPPEKVETNDTLHIEYWDDAQSSATTEDWESEWTGSLDKTTVFSPSTSTAAKLPPVNELNISGGSLNNCTDIPSMNSVLNQVNNVNANLSSGLSSNVDSVLSLNQNSQQLGNVTGTASHSYPGGVSSSNSLAAQGQAIDLAALLRKAAPHSTLGRLPNSQMVDTGGLAPSLVGDVKGNLLSGISSSVSDSINSNMLSSTNPDGIVVSASQPSYSSSMSNSIFSSTSDLGASLTSVSNDVKGLGLSSQRAKPQRSRLPHSSRIPSQAVEMPEVAMAALDMQFTGLEFGTETFDFGSEMKPLMPIASSSMNNLDVSSASATKDLSGLGSSLPQSQTLGSQPIPFPTQPSDRKPQTGGLLSGPTRSSVSDSTSGLSELTKKDSGSGSSGPSLGTLVGSVSSAHSYQASVSAAYGSKVSSFPSPPTHHFSQNTAQNYSNTGSSGVNNNTYVGTSGTGTSLGSNTGNSSQTGAVSGYSSGYSSNNVQYQNNYVNVSSHSLSSLNASKAHSTMKDPSQVNYSDASGASSSLGSSLSTTSGVTNNSTGLSLGLGSPPTSPIQPKNSVSAGKSVNNLVSGPPGVQRHSVTQPTLNQHLPTHHHLQQQQQVAQQSQAQQLLPGPSQYVSPQQATLPGTLPPPFYNVQQPAMYSLEELQYFQQRIPHMPQASSTLPGSRDSSISSAAQSYSVTDSSKFRTDHNSSPVPSTMNQQQQGGAGGAAFMTAPGNASMAPFYMYQTMPGVPSTFPQYGTPAIIQIPSNTHTGSSTSQFPGPPKIPYGGTSAYYDTISQNQDYKSYGSGSQGQTKSGPPNSAVSGSSSSSDIASYKNHLSKVGRSYDKQAYHTGTPPPPFNLAGSGTNPIAAAAAAANYAPMFIPTMPAAQHHSTLMHHHQLHQDGSSTGGQRGGNSGSQSKGPSKGPYSGSYWAS